MLVPTLGGFVAGFLVRFFQHGGRPHVVADIDQLLYASDLLNRVPVPWRAGDDLTTGLRLMDAGVVDRLPVVADDDSSRAIGIAHRAETLKVQGEALKATWRANQGGA